MAALTSHAAPLVRVADIDAQTYEAWIDNTITQLNGDDDSAQHMAADQLAHVIVYPPSRGKVLAALEPHIDSKNRDLRIRCVRAFGHWATARQVPQLLDVVATPPNPPNMSGDEPCWVVADVALIGLDPTAALAATDRRRGNFFFATASQAR